MKIIIILALLFPPSICISAPTRMIVEKDQSVIRLRAELNAAGFVVVSITPQGSLQIGNEKIRIQDSIIQFDRELSQVELNLAQSIIDAHEGNLARKIRLKIIIKNLTKKLRDDTITSSQIKILLLALIEAWRFEE